MMSIRSDLTLREILSAGKDTRVIPVSTDDRLVIGIVPKSEKKVKTKEINLQSCPASVVTNEILLAGQKLVSFCLIHLFFCIRRLNYGFQICVINLIMVMNIHWLQFFVFPLY
jgi:hypothetical protein